MSQIERRIEAMEKALNPEGGHCHVILARDDEDADRQILEVKKWDPKPRAILVIERLHKREEVQNEGRP